MGGCERKSGYLLSPLGRIQSTVMPDAKNKGPNKSLKYLCVLVPNCHKGGFRRDQERGRRNSCFESFNSASVC